MALAYLLDPCQQYSNVAGVNNVAGWFEVFISDTAERADVYVDFAGTRAPERIAIDNDGRAVMVVDGDGVYRVEMHAPNGDLLWTQYPVWPMGQGGGGAIGVDIGSSDGSVDVQRTQVGSVVNYDLSVAADGTDLLGWGEFAGYTMDGTHMVPSYSAGTIVAGQHGIRLQGGQYYHVTVALGASSAEQNVYDAFQVSFRGVDGEGAVSTFSTKSFHYDASTGEGQSYDVSFDVMPAADVELYAEATGLESGISVGLSEVYVHRVYSGAPAIPGGVAEKEWVEENYQEKLTAGEGIVIDEPNRVISIDPETVQGKLTPGEGISIDEEGVISTTGSNNTFTAIYGVTTLSEIEDAVEAGDSVFVTGIPNESGKTLPLVVFRPNLNSASFYAYTLTAAYLVTIGPGGRWEYGAYNAQADWNESNSSAPAYVKNKPTVDQAYDASSSNAQSGTAVAEAMAAADNLFVAVYGVTTIDEVDTAYARGKDLICRYNDGHGHVYSSQLSSRASGMYTFTTTDGFSDYEFTLSPDGGTGAWSIGSRAIPSGTQLVPAATASDAGEVLTVDQNGVPEWAPAQAPISAGNGIDITNNVVSAKVDGTSVTFNANGELEATAAPQVQSDWAESDPADVSFIQNKPGQKSLVAGANITIVDDVQSNTVTISAAAAQAPVQDVTVGGVSVLNAQGVAEVPSIPVIGTVTL